MTRSRWTVLVLVLAALGLSVARGLQGSKPEAHQSARTRGLQAAAALEPCPNGISTFLPKVTLPCLGGGRDVPVAGAGTGLPTLVNIYGSWCTPCYKEMPVLAQFAAKAQGRVALVGIDSEDDFDNALQFAKQRDQHWPAVYDNDAVIRPHYASKLPATLFLDATGKVVFVQRDTGYSSLAQLEADVRQHLGIAL
ncbi:MAG: TlpA family protein disulfide reductase [Frankiales bacterium]|nr:TlpA family protein disulfide reductase [Frankiales bacterium]